jgi:NAD(P)H-nitrite reductase large subunit
MKVRKKGYVWGSDVLCSCQTLAGHVLLAACCSVVFVTQYKKHVRCSNSCIFCLSDLDQLFWCKLDSNTHGKAKIIRDTVGIARIRVEPSKSIAADTIYTSRNTRRW